MTASDLMIGDWISVSDDSTSIGLVEGIALGETYIYFAYSNEAFEFDYKEIHPVPLSDDWLDKFGFIKCERNGLVWWALFFQNDARLRIECVGDIYTCTQVKRQIKYVHELQQLARAFTGEALTIKPQ